MLGGQNAVEVASQVSQQSEAEKLAALFERYFAEDMQLNPISATFVGINKYNDQFSLPISQQNLRLAEAFEKRYLQEISAIDETILSGQNLLSYQIFKGDRELAMLDQRFERTPPCPLAQNPCMNSASMRSRAFWVK